jgi:hypothetical protein
LKDEKKYNGQKSESQSISNEKKEGQLAEEKRLDIQVNVYVVNEQGKKGA